MIERGEILERLEGHEVEIGDVMQSVVSFVSCQLRRRRGNQLAAISLMALEGDFNSTLSGQKVCNYHCKALLLISWSYKNPKKVLGMWTLEGMCSLGCSFVRILLYICNFLF